jgi:hypothetical protein
VPALVVEAETHVATPGDVVAGGLDLHLGQPGVQVLDVLGRGGSCLLRRHFLLQGLELLPELLDLLEQFLVALGHQAQGRAKKRHGQKP